MRKVNDVFRPINELEKRIFSDEEFLTAIKIGKSRAFHKEGTVKNHIQQILKYINTKYKSTKYYEDLRIIAILHDTGKFALLEKLLEIYLPELPAKEQKELIAKSAIFAKKYFAPEDITTNMMQYKFTSGHACRSYSFAKKFLKNRKLLDVIRYHDIAIDFKKIYEETGAYDAKMFKKIFSKVDLRLFVLFLECDNCNRQNNISEWLNVQLKLYSLI